MPNDVSQVGSQWNENNVIDLIKGSFRFRHSIVKILPESLEGKSDFLIITWSTENNPLDSHDTDYYQQNESTPRKCVKVRSAGVAFHV